MTDILPLTIWVISPILISTFVIWALLRSAERKLFLDDPRPSRRVSTSAVLLLIGWLAAAFSLGWMGIFEAKADTLFPFIALGIFFPLVVGYALLSRSKKFDRVLNHVPQHWLVAIQLYRAFGVTFLLLYSAEMLPGAFALPAGIGDIAVGLAAPAVAYLYAAGYKRSCLAVLLWNVLGIADLVLAVTTGFLTSPGPFHVLALDHPNMMMTALPLVLIPTFAVPLSILLHLSSLRVLRQTVRQSRQSWDSQKACAWGAPMNASAGRST